MTSTFRLGRVSATLAAVPIAALLAVASPRAAIIDRVLARVDGRLITLSDVRAVTELDLIGASADSRAEPLVDRLIERELILQEVERYAPPEPDASVVAAREAEIERRVSGPSPIADRLVLLGLDRTWLQQWVRNDLRIQSYIDQRFAGAVEPSDEELENYFREHRNELPSADQDTPSPDAQRIARERVMADRRKALIAEWLDGLKRRADITRPASVTK
jgi:hypothetical protein